MQKFWFSILIVFIITGSLSGQSHKIDIHLKGMTDSTLLIAYHYGEQKFIYDTLISYRNGEFELVGEDTIPGGVYLVVLPDMKYFEFLIGDDQNFSVSTDVDDIIPSLEFKGSKENTAFLEYQRFLMQLNKTNYETREKMKSFINEPDSLASLQSIIDNNNEKLEIYLEDLHKKFPDSFIGDLVYAMAPPQVPDFNIPENQINKDSLKMALSYGYYRDHFFDNLNFSNDKLIRTPILQNKLDTYFNKVLMQLPDSIIPQIHLTAEKASANKEIFQYFVIFVLNNFLESKIMGMDEVFVDVAETYYLTGEAYWSDSVYLEKLRDRVNKTKPNLIGAKAQELKMETITGEWVSLHETTAKYTILYFWEPNCGFCKTETPKLYNLFKKYQDHGLVVFAIDTQGDRKQWEDYINEHAFDWINAWDPHQQTYFRYYYDIHSTPTLYLLDNNKTIIAKRIDVDQLSKMLGELFAE